MFCKMYRGKEKGFTLVELLVVIGIIGILALLLLPQFRGMRDRARVASCQSNLKNLSSQLEAEFVDRDSYPNDARWNTLTTGNGMLVRLAACPLGAQPYTYTPDKTILPNPDPLTIDDLASALDTAPGMGYIVDCTQNHNGTATSEADGYPTVVQLYVTPDGVVRKQTYFP